MTENQDSYQSRPKHIPFNEEWFRRAQALKKEKGPDVAYAYLEDALAYAFDHVAPSNNPAIPLMLWYKTRNELTAALAEAPETEDVEETSEAEEPDTAEPTTAKAQDTRETRKTSIYYGPTANTVILSDIPIDSTSEYVAIYPPIARALGLRAAAIYGIVLSYLLRGKPCWITDEQLCAIIGCIRLTVRKELQTLYDIGLLSKHTISQKTYRRRKLTAVPLEEAMSILEKRKSESENNESGENDEGDRENNGDDHEDHEDEED